MSPEIPDLGWGGFQTDIRPLQAHLRALGAAVEQSNRLTAIRERSDPDLLIPSLACPSALFTGRVLIDRDHFAIRQDVVDRRLHIAQVVSSQKRRGKDRPQTH